jgi:hypothetical protein
VNATRYPANGYAAKIPKFTELSNNIFTQESTIDRASNIYDFNFNYEKYM